MDAKSVLLVEDDQLLIDMYSQFLELGGFTVERASDGIKALELAKSGRFGAILLDLRIPGKPGLEILSELKSGPKPTASKVIILSNLTPDDATQATIDQLADDFLVKSDIVPGQLVERVHQLLES